VRRALDERARDDARQLSKGECRRCGSSRTLRSAEAAIFIGVTPAAADDRAINSGGTSVGTLQAIRRIDKNLDPHAFGFALDLDNGRLYISESGVWPDGDPAARAATA
jgi:hypothetical protein